MNNDTKRTFKNMVFEVSTVIALLAVAMSAAYGYGSLNSRVIELEDKCKSLVIVREDIAAMKVMMGNILEFCKEKHQ